MKSHIFQSKLVYTSQVAEQPLVLAENNAQVAPKDHKIHISDSSHDLSARYHKAYFGRMSTIYGRLEFFRIGKQVQIVLAR